MAAQKKQKKGSYLHDFKEKPGGGFAYTGKVWHAEPDLLRRMLIKLWALQAVMLLSALLPGFVTTAGLLNTFYVIIPYVLWLISDVALAVTLFNVTLGGNPLRDYIYERGVAGYGLRAVLPLIGAVLTAAGLVIFLLRGGSGEGGWLCFVCCGIQALASFLAVRSKFACIWAESAPVK